MAWYAHLILFTLGFVLATGLTAARAAEAYLCEGGRIVYVAIDQLEVMKRSDPCIASYYGVTLNSPTDTAHSVAVADIETAAPAPLPASQGIRTPRDMRAADKAGNRTAISKRQPAERKPLRAAEGTDYRNVHVINAASPDVSLFRHER